jgi:FKBP-type peptidyl-prolyl cis-trans isomerase
MGTKILVAVASVAVIALIIGAVLVLGSGSKNEQAATATTPTPAAASDKLTSTDTVVGTGAEAKEGSSITVKYTGKLADGTVFDSTDKQGGQPATFTLAKGSLIDGWVQGIPGMKVGGKRTLVIPPALAYGAQANGSIPANSTLTFDIELVDVK